MPTEKFGIIAQPTDAFCAKTDKSFICEGLRPVVPTTGDTPYAIADLVFSYTESG